MKTKAFQVYGYVVCVISVISFLIAVTGLVNAISDLNAPLYSGFNHDVSLASYEAYKVDAMQAIDSDAAYIPSDAEIMTMYNAAIVEETARRSHNATKNLITNATVILFAVILFITHWKWVIKGGED